MRDALTVTVPSHLAQRLYQACRDEADRLVREAGGSAQAAAGEDPIEAAQLVELGMMERPLAAQLAGVIADLKRRWMEAQGLADRLLQGPRYAIEQEWERALAEATATAAAELRAQDAEGRARADRAAAAAAMSWGQMAEALWGPNWQTPLAEVTGINLRRVQRIFAGEAILPSNILTWLEETMTLVRPEWRLAYGDALRAALSVEGGAAAVERALRDLNNDRMP